MQFEKADLIIHPVRLRILQLLYGHQLTTQEIANHLPDVPKSSIYRHLKKLLQANLVEVAEINNVKGTEEKVYHAVTPPLLTQEDVKDFTKEDHLRYFSAYTATLIQGFKNYLDSQENPDFFADRTGYREIRFYASVQEMDQVFARFNEDLLKLVNNPPQTGRRLRKLVTINHPEIEERNHE